MKSLLNEIKVIIDWILWLGRNERKYTSLTLWIKGFTIYIDGVKIFDNDNNYHHLAIIANDHKENGLGGQISDVAIWKDIENK